MKHRAPFTIALAVWGLLPLNLLALDQKMIKERTEQLQKMSEVERDRLNRNIVEFQKLSPAEKQHYRDLHAALLDDRVHVGGLSSLLQTYSIWVQTLTPKQRSELQQETVPAQKLALIHKFKEEQEHREPSTEPDERHAEEPVQQPSPNFGPRVALSLKDLNAVMAILVDRLPADQTKQEFSHPRLSDYLPIIHASVQSSGGNYREWPDEGLLQQMIGALSKESTPLVSKSKSKRETLIQLVLLGVIRQARESVHFPSDDEKREILEKLSDTERQRIMNQHKDNMNWFLVQKYFETKGGDSLIAFKKIGEYRRPVEDLFSRLDVPLPPRFQRSKFGGDRPRAKG